MFYVNDIIEFTSINTKYRIIHLDFPSDSAWLFPLFGKNPMPVFSRVATLEESLLIGKAILVQVVGQIVQTDASKAAVGKRDASYDSIKPLINEIGIFVPSERNRLINARADELNCSPRTLMRVLRLYWAGGQTRNALLPKFHTRGNTKGTTSSRGRPPKYIDRNIFQVTEEDLKIFKQVIERKYLKGFTATIAGTHALMLREHYSVIDSEGDLQALAPGEFPTVQQFRRYFKSHYSHEIVIRCREGDAEFELNHRAKLGNAELSVFTVGDNFEIDATIADVFLVSSVDRSSIVGKPTLYLVIDSKSWLIVGFYTGFEQPSWPAALQAIVSIAEDKKVLCERYGLSYRVEDWPAHGVLPKEFTGDRGEMIAKESTRISDELEITIKNLPAKMANRKPHVECGFHLIQRPMAEHIPGYEPPENFRKRQGKHYDKDACLTLDEFTGIILRSIIRFNNSPRAGYPLTPAQTLSGLMPTPCNLWNHEIRARAGSLPRYSSDYLRLALLSRAKASVTREGIQFKGCFYSCDEAIERGWFVRAGRGSFEVTVSYDRRLVDNIYVHGDVNSKAVFTASLLEKSAAFTGMSLQEVEFVIFERERIRQEGKYHSLRRDFDFHNAVDPITSKARAEAKQQSKGKSRSSRKVDIRQHRTEELTRERQEKALLNQPSKQLQKAEILTLPVSTPTSDHLAPAKPARNAKLLGMLNGD